MVLAVALAVGTGGLRDALAASDPPAADSVYAWYRGDAGLNIGADKYGITSWVNQGTSGATNTAQQAARDLVNLTGAPQKLYLVRSNGAAAGAVRFGGGDGIWASKANFGILSGDRTVVACVRVRDGFKQGFLFDATSYSPGLTRVQVRSNVWQVSAAGAMSSAYGPQSGAPAGAVTTNVWEVHSFMVTTNGGQPHFLHWVDGVQAADVTLSTNGSLSGLMIGANVSQQFGIVADVAELLVFNTALQPAVRANVEQYLAEKWGGVGPDPGAPPPPLAYNGTPVFVNGQEGYGCYRIPAMVTSAKGTVLAVADGRISGCGDIPNPLDLVLKRSFDNGKTWGPLQLIAGYGSDTSTNDVDVYPAYGITTPIQRLCAGDAALLLDRTNSRIWVLYDNGAAKTGGARVIKLELRYSDDDGQSWSPAVDVEALNPGLRPGGGEFLCGPGNGIQLTTGPAAGRLIFPVYVYGNPSSSLVIYSDDHGQTWKPGGIAGAGGGEIQVAETPNGGLLASMRDNNFATSGVRTFSRSEDGGITWGAPYSALANPPVIPDPACQASLFRLTTTNNSNASRLVSANAASSSARVAMTLRLSYDEGVTWPVSNLVYAGSSAYSAVTALANGDIGLLFEIDNYTRIDFVRRSVSDITGGADKLPPYTTWSGSLFSPIQLMDPAVSGPAADPDGDGASNEAEFTANTDPLNADSVLKVKLAPPSPGEYVAVLRFMAAANRNYTVQARRNFNAGGWEPIAEVGTQAQNSVVELPIATTNQSCFYRLAVLWSP